MTVVHERDANPAKMAATLGYGADDRVRGRRSDEPRADRRASSPSATGLALVHPFDDWNVIAGQGTATLELLEEVPGLDAVVTPIGGGGLLSGAALACRRPPRRRGLRRRARRLARCAALARRGPQRVRLDYAPLTIADGARTVQMGERTFAVLSELLRGHRARRRRRSARGAGARLAHDEAADRAHVGDADRGDRWPARCPGERIGVVLSGGNVDAARVAGRL